jgi:hypothetical protein
MTPYTPHPTTPTPHIDPNPTPHCGTRHWEQKKKRCRFWGFRLGLSLRKSAGTPNTTPYTCTLQPKLPKPKTRNPKPETQNPGQSKEKRRDTAKRKQRAALVSVVSGGGGGTQGDDPEMGVVNPSLIHSSRNRSEKFHLTPYSLDTRH